MMQTKQGAAGLALAASLALSVLGAWMWLSLRSRLGGWDNGATTSVLWKGTLAAAATYAVAVVVVHFSGALIAANGFENATATALVKFVARFGVLALGTLAGVGTFLAAAKILRLPLRGASAANGNTGNGRPDKGQREAARETSPRVFTEYRVPPAREAKSVHDHVPTDTKDITG
jgi:hypothetical protein